MNNKKVKMDLHLALDEEGVSFDKLITFTYFIDYFKLLKVMNKL